MLKRIWRYCDRFLSMLLCHVIVAQVLYWQPSRDPSGGNLFADTLFADRVMAVTCLIALAVLLYRLNAIASLYDDGMRERLYADGVRQHSVKERLCFLVSQRRLWAEGAVWVILYLALPLDWTWSVLGEFVLQGQTGIMPKLMLLPLLLVVCVPLCFAARVRAVDHWFAHQVGEQKLYDRGKKRKDPSQKAFDRAVIANVFSVSVVAAVAGIVIPSLVGYLPALLTLFTSRAAFVVLVLWLLWYVLHTGRRIHRRRKFLKRLRAVCAAKGYTLDPLELPYRSLFMLYDGANAHLCAGEREYSVKFLTVKSRRKPLVLYENGVCEFLTVVRFGRAEVSRLSRAYSFAWEADGKKILLLDPAPYKVLNARAEELDNASVVGEYKLFTGNAFLNALERDCADR